MDLPTIDRPREKLWELGAENLQESELIAILLGTGTRADNAVSLAKRLLRIYPLATLASLAPAQLTNTAGIGNTKAARIVAALELGRRLFAPVATNKVFIRTTTDALAQVTDIAHKTQEHLLALYINARYELIRKETISLGSLNTINVEPRTVFAPVIASACAWVILAHNHPSGDPTPSEADIRFTARLQAAGELLGISIVDHLIVSGTGYCSFKEQHLI